MTTSKSRILFILTGSIACYKACNVISKLVQSGYDVQVVASTSALNFIGAATLEGLSGKPVLSDLWATGKAMDHIQLMRWADLILIAPATANTINKMAGGIGDDLISTLFLAHDFKKPLLIAPAMNTSMYIHPVTKSSIARLQGLGINILETASGVLACGEIGAGKLLDPELVFAEVELALAHRTSRNFKVLITSGGTQEPIDDVRVLTNRSTGATGAKMAERLFDLGVDVTLLHAEAAIQPQRQLETESFVSFTDLETALRKRLHENSYDLVIHAAAVADFAVENPKLGEKIRSDEVLDIRFRKNPKLVNQIKSWSPGTKLVAFKMTSTVDENSKVAAVKKLFLESQADLIVQNDIRQIDWKTGKHSFNLYRSSAQESQLPVEDIEQLSDLLFTEVISQKEFQ